MYQKLNVLINLSGIFCFNNKPLSIWINCHVYFLASENRNYLNKILKRKPTKNKPKEKQTSKKKTTKTKTKNHKWTNENKTNKKANYRGTSLGTKQGLPDQAVLTGLERKLDRW